MKTATESLITKNNKWFNKIFNNFIKSNKV